MMGLLARKSRWAALAAAMIAVFLLGTPAYAVDGFTVRPAGQYYQRGHASFDDKTPFDKEQLFVYDDDEDDGYGVRAWLWAGKSWTLLGSEYDSSDLGGNSDRFDLREGIVVKVMVCLVKNQTHLLASSCKTEFGAA
jgi:hypothetical protein